MGRGPGGWLRDIVDRGVLDVEDEREVQRRAQAELLSLSDMRILLLTPLVGLRAAAVRETVFDVVRRQPHYAPSILAMHVNELRLPRPVLDHRHRGVGGLFDARCSVHLSDQLVVGEWCTARTKKAAEQHAQVSVLARLAGVPRTSSATGTDLVSADDSPRIGNVVVKYHEHTYLDRDRFLAVLTDVVGLPNVAPAAVDHVVLRARSGLLTAEELALVLFAPRQAVWDRARRECLAAADRSPELASQVIELHPLAIGGRLRWEVTPSTDHSARYAATVHVGADPDSVVVGPVEALGRATARQAAAMRMLAHLTGVSVPESSVDSGHLLVMPQGATAVGVLDQGKQRGTLLNLAFTTDSEEPPFTHRAWCQLGDATLEASANGMSKKGAKNAAARILLLMVNQHLDQIARASRHLSDQSPQRTVDVSATKPKQASLRVPVHLLPSGTSADTGFVIKALSDGHEVTFDVDVPVLQAGLLLVDGGAGVRSARKSGSAARSVLMPGSEVHQVTCHRIDTMDFLTLACSGDQEGWSDSARVWAEAARRALEMIKNGWVLPAIADADQADLRQPTWRLGPLPGYVRQAISVLAEQLRTAPRCLRTSTRDSAVELVESVDMIGAFLDAVANRFVPSPGARLLLGVVPFAAAVHHRDPLSPMQDWIDAIEDGVGVRSHTPPLIMRIEAPVGDDPRLLNATLLLGALADSMDTAVEAAEVWTGRERSPSADPELRHRVRQALRRASAVFAPLRLLGVQPRPDKIVLDVADAVALRGQTGEALRELGITVNWHKDWAAYLDVDIAIGTGTPAPTFDGHLGLTDVLDRRWRISLDGRPLTDDELDLLAAAALPCVRLHNRWVLLDDTVRPRLVDRQLRPVNRAQGLLALLQGGTMQVEGRSYACSAADGIAYLLDQLNTPASVGSSAEVDNSTLQLHPYQLAAVNWLIRRALLGINGLLADDMGTGKTATALGFHLHPRRPIRHRPTLVLVPNRDVMNAWLAEIDKRAPDVHVCEYWSTKRSLADVRGSSLVLTTYELLKKDHDELASRPWGLVIADEAQKIKNPATVAARMARAIPDALRLPMTGTPLENTAQELWSILDWANPTLVGTRAQFTSRYVRPLRQPASDAEAQQARTRLRDLATPLMLRRLNDDPELGLGLPPLTETTHTTPMSPEQSGLHEALLLDTEDQLALCADSSRRGELVFNLIVDQREICNSPDHYSRQDPSVVAADPVAAAERAPKLALLDAVLRDLPPDESVLVFTNYTRMGGLLVAYLDALGYATGFFHGQAGERDRRTALDQIGDGSTRVLVLTYGSGGCGLTITRPNHVIHYDRHWNPAVEAQANGRARRIGQHRTVHVHHLVTLNSIEERITARSADKRHFADLVLPSGHIDHKRTAYDELRTLAGLHRRR